MCIGTFYVEIRKLFHPDGRTLWAVTNFQPQGDEQNPTIYKNFYDSINAALEPGNVVFFERKNQEIVHYGIYAGRDSVLKQPLIIHRDASPAIDELISGCNANDAIIH